MKKLIFLIPLLLAGQSFGQSHDEILQRFLEQRKRMMEEIMKAFDDDKFFQDDFFTDDLIEDFRNQGLGGFKGFKGAGEHISVEEKMQKDGSIDVVITPKNKDTKLDIETKDDSITIKSEVRIEEKSAGNGQRSNFSSIRSFSQTVSIPHGYKAQTPEKKGESIIISLVPDDDNILKPDENGRTPVKKAPGQQTI